MIRRLINGQADKPDGEQYVTEIEGLGILFVRLGRKPRSTR
jgi:hypothetical protein